MHEGARMFASELSGFDSDAARRGTVTKRHAPGTYPDRRTLALL